MPINVLELYLCLSVHGQCAPDIHDLAYTTQGSCFSILWRCGMVYPNSHHFISERLKTPMVSILSLTQKSRRPLLQNQSKYHQKHHKNQSIPHVSKTKHHNIMFMRMFILLFGDPNPSRSLARVAQLSHQSVGTYWQMLNFTQAKGPWFGAAKMSCNLA